MSDRQREAIVPRAADEIIVATRFDECGEGAVGGGPGVADTTPLVVTPCGHTKTLRHSHPPDRLPHGPIWPRPSQQPPSRDRGEALSAFRKTRKSAGRCDFQSRERQLFRPPAEEPCHSRLAMTCPSRRGEGRPQVDAIALAAADIGDPIPRGGIVADVAGARTKRSAPRQPSSGRMRSGRRPTCRDRGRGDDRGAGSRAGSVPRALSRRKAGEFGAKGQTNGCDTGDDAAADADQKSFALTPSRNRGP